MRGLVLSKALGVPFYRQLRDQVADRIRSGALEPGAPLPSIRELAASLAVSVITVKGAYDELEREGLIASQQGRGTFVSPQAQAASRKQIARDVEEQFAAAAERSKRLGVALAQTLAIADGAIRRAFKKEEP